MRGFRFAACLWVFLLAICLGPAGADAQTIYKYKDKKGTTHFVQDPGQIPKDHQGPVETMVMEERKTSPTQVVDQIKRKAEQVASPRIGRVRDALASFLQTQKAVVVGYVFAGVILFYFLSRLLKRFQGGFMFRILVRVGLAMVLMAGAYTIYSMWLSKQISGLGLPVAGGGAAGATAGTRSGSGKSLPNLMTPADLIRVSKEVAAQMNAHTRTQQKMLDELDK
ncbi:MAG: DUF4124 domain-containing protein [Proteobacteria bacterium]|nr:DUF4124 domain-containing protein [Pseudomonadota bacterium]